LAAARSGLAVVTSVAAIDVEVFEASAAAVISHICEFPLLKKKTSPAWSAYAAPYAPEGIDCPVVAEVTVLLVTTPDVAEVLAIEIMLSVEPVIP
jgi:hypothetical protein